EVGVERVVEKHALLADGRPNVHLDRGDVLDRLSEDAVDGARYGVGRLRSDAPSCLRTRVAGELLRNLQPVLALAARRQQPALRLGLALLEGVRLLLPVLDPLGLLLRPADRRLGDVEAERLPVVCC